VKEMAFSQHYHDEDGRRKWQDPEAILTGIGLKPGHVLIDMGCGEGFFSMPAARIVGPSGKVIGVDINEKALSHLEERSETERLTNLVLVVSKAEEAAVCDGCADFVLFAIDLHDFEDPGKVLQNAKRMLKPTGRLIDLDWKRKMMKIGPPIWIRFDEEKATGLIEKAGFTVESVSDSGPMHYLVVAKPQ
jgi:ubiquinone/menaquinone biosynthesis C-methylase UbiE